MPLQIYKIASTTVTASAGQANIEFTNIPQGYTDLKVKLTCRSTRSSTNDNLKVAFNGLTTNLSCRIIDGNGTSATSDNSGSIIFSTAGTAGSSTGSVFSNFEIYVPNYSGSTNKSLSIDGVGENNATLAYATLTAGLWASTSAITSIQFTWNVGPNFAQYSTATLYGVL